MNTGGTTDQGGFTVTLVRADHSAAWSRWASTVPLGQRQRHHRQGAGRADDLSHGRHRHLRRHGADRRDPSARTSAMVPIGDRFTMGGEVAALAVQALLPARRPPFPATTASFPIIDPTADRFVAALDGDGHQVVRAAARRLGRVEHLRPAAVGGCSGAAGCYSRAPSTRSAGLAIHVGRSEQPSGASRISRASPSPDEDVPHLQGELNAILGFVEQLNEVDVDGVEPMTSVTPMAMKKRDGRRHRRRHRRRRSLANAPATRGRLLPRAEGGRVASAADARP